MALGVAGGTGSCIYFVKSSGSSKDGSGVEVADEKAASVSKGQAAEDVGSGVESLQAAAGTGGSEDGKQKTIAAPAA